MCQRAPMAWTMCEGHEGFLVREHSRENSGEGASFLLRGEPVQRWRRFQGQFRENTLISKCRCSVSEAARLKTRRSVTASTFLLTEEYALDQFANSFP